MLCSSEATDLQKEEAIKNCNVKAGMYIVETGKVDSVRSKDGYILLEVTHCSDAWNPQARVKMKESERDRLLILTAGDTVKYKAILKRCTSGFFFAGIEAEEGILVS